MSRGLALMLGLGLAALIGGITLLTRRGGGEQAVYGRRIAGTMLTGLGLTLTVFAVGLWNNGTLG